MAFSVCWLYSFCLSDASFIASLKFFCARSLALSPSEVAISVPTSTPRAVAAATYGLVSMVALSNACAFCVARILNLAMLIARV